MDKTNLLTDNPSTAMLERLRDELQVFASSGEPRDPDWAERRVRRINRFLARLQDQDKETHND